MEQNATCAQPLQHPCYVYEKAKIEANCALLRDTFEGAQVLYSIKANPFEPVIACIAKSGIGSDSASLREVQLSVAAGMRPEDVYYSSMGKTERDLTESLDHCVLIADSLGELERLDGLAGRLGRSVKAGLRLNPTYSWNGGVSGASKFGVDEQTLLESGAFLAGLKNVSVVGIHTHLRSQQLDAKTLAGYYERVYAAAEGLRDKLGLEMEFINFGGGVGVPFCDRERPMDFALLKAEFAKLVEKNRAGLGARLLVESGRFLTCQTGTYLTDIVDIKTSHGRKYLVVTNGINGYLRPVMKELLRDVANESFSGEPFFTHMDAFQYSIDTDETETERVDLVGNLCTAVDVLAKDIVLPKAKVGDTVRISNAGSYAYSLSSLLFSSQEPPKQYLV